MVDRELKPCPFCGGEAELKKGKIYLDEAVQVYCKKCSVHTQKEPINHLLYTNGEVLFVTEAMAIEMAINAWNRRANDETRTDN